MTGAGAVAAQGAGDGPEAVLAAEGVGVTVEGRVLLAPADLAFRRGSVTGLIGHNGSGKTTLLKCLSRQLAPTRGRVLMGGAPAASLGARAFARRLAYLPQQLPASTGLTVRELVALGRYPWHGPLGRIGPHGLAAVAGALHVAGLDGFADRLVDTLSGGERQRAWIAMLVAQEAGFMLLDEPLAALDLAHQTEVMRLLRRLAETRRAGIVLVVHDINVAARFCDRILALRAGAVVADGPPAALMQASVLETIFGLPMRVLAGAPAPVAVPA